MSNHRRVSIARDVGTAWIITFNNPCYSRSLRFHASERFRACCREITAGRTRVQKMIILREVTLIAMGERDDASTTNKTNRTRCVSKFTSDNAIRARGGKRCEHARVEYKHTIESSLAGAKEEEEREQ